MNIASRLPSRLRSILLHTTSVLCFVMYETSIVIFSKQPFNGWVLSLFYILDVAWFYLLAYRIYPYLQLLTRSNFIRTTLGVLALSMFALILLLANQISIWIYTGQANLAITDFLIFRSIWRGVYISLIALCFWYHRDRISKAQELQLQTELRFEAERRQLELENAYLRSQVNPHLLFNSLTYLYKEALINLPNASQPVMLIAEMMDYALNPGINGKATIQEEAKHIDRLVRLYQLLGDRAGSIRFNSAIENTDLLIPPLIFNHFVENVLKYGVLNDIQNPATIELKERDRVVELTTINQIKEGSQPGHGQGLNNTQARLNKHYPGRHNLQIDHIGLDYITRLQIEL